MRGSTSHSLEVSLNFPTGLILKNCSRFRRFKRCVFYLTCEQRLCLSVFHNPFLPSTMLFIVPSSLCLVCLAFNFYGLAYFEISLLHHRKKLCDDSEAASRRILVIKNCPAVVDVDAQVFGFNKNWPRRRKGSDRIILLRKFKGWEEFWSLSPWSR